MSQPLDKPVAIAELFRRHAAELCGYLRARRGALDAEDIVQESFARLLATSQTDAPDNPRAWLYRTGANLAADAHDHRQVRSRLHIDWPDLADEAVDSCADPARHAEASQKLQHIWTALQHLPEPCRQAFLLNRFDNLSHRATAVQLGLSEKTVERHILRALETCRRAGGM